MKPRLLLCSAISPFPRHSGGATRIYYTLKYLSQNYQLYFLTFGTPITDQAEKDFLAQTCQRWQVFPLSNKKFNWRIPYHFTPYHHPHFIPTLQQWQKEEKIKLVRFEFTQMAHYVKALPPTCQTTFVAHDISLVSFYRRWQEKSMGGKKIISFFNLIPLYFYEKKWLARYQNLKVVSVHDQAWLQRLLPTTNITLEPNGIEAINFLPRRVSKKIKLGFIGSTAHPPNQKALDFIIKQILPELQRQQIPYEFYLAGNNQFKINQAHCINLGPVTQVGDFFTQIDLLLAPLQSGSGTRIKILEALSYGRPVLTTPIGAEGLNIKHPYLEIMTDDRLWVEKIMMLSQLTPDNLNELKIQLEPYLWSHIFAKKEK